MHDDLGWAGLPETGDQMAIPTAKSSGVRSPGRAAIAARTLRTDRWWAYPLITFTVLLAFVAYATYAAIANRDYYAAPYISPFYSPCLSFHCGTVPGSYGAPHLGWFGTWWIVTPAVIILIFPLGFRLTCYYYRKAYYRSWWLSPPACAVPEPNRRYTGETRFPLLGQNAHRYFFYAALAFNVILTWDAVVAFDFGGHIGIGVGSGVLVVNAVLLWLYSLSCHACRHAVGGRINHFSRHPIRYQAWTFVSRLNPYHGNFAWLSLAWVALDMHPLDAGDRRAVLRERQGLGLCNITKCCTEVCPAGIKITDNAIIPMKERSADQRYDPLGRVLRSWRRREGRTPAG